MPYLGDYIGHLLSEMTIARMHADLEAMRVAELYASHPLLRHMPVPHFRLPEVNMDVPLAIKQVEESKPDQSPRGAAPIGELRKTFESLIGKQLTRHGFEVPPEFKKRLKLVLDEEIGELRQPTETGVGVRRIADRFVNAALGAFKDVQRVDQPIKKERIEKLESELKQVAQLEFLKLRPAPPRLHVLATTNEIREVGSSENLTRIKLRVTEDAVEWTTIESEGQMQDRLVPE